MTTSTVSQTGTLASVQSWFRRAEAWLDDRGRPAWYAAMILGFVFCWPAGLAILGYMIWSKRMFGCSSRRRERGFSRPFPPTRFRSSGNSAFDAYKADTIDRLEREQEEFEGFLRRLRESKDKAEFDAYMEDRAKAARAEDDTLPAVS